MVLKDLLVELIGGLNGGYSLQGGVKTIRFLGKT